MATYSPSKITKDGNTYNFTDDTKIPLSGTNALAGSIVPDTDNAYDFGSSAKNIKILYAKNIIVSGTGNGLKSNNSSESMNIGYSLGLGASIDLCGKDYTFGNNQGKFILNAIDSNGYHIPLIGSPDGTLTWNSKNVAMQEDTIPRSGGAVMIGSLARVNNTGDFDICGGIDYSQGGYITVRGKSKPLYGGTAQIGVNDGSQSKVMVLYPNGAWTWTGSACVVSSDSRLKDEIESISNDVLDAWENLEPKQYKLKSDLENAKDTAQTHYGWIAQDVESIIKGDRKGDVKNGLWLHEEWEEQEEVSHEETYTEESQTKDGTTETVIKTRKVIDTPYRAKGDSYGLRYTECLVVECAYLRKKNKELQEQLDKLSARLDKLEGVQTK